MNVADGQPSCIKAPNSEKAGRRMICLSNVYDQGYHDLRVETIDRSLAWRKRRDLFNCLQLATGWDLLVLSAPPKGKQRRSFKRLSPVQTTFCDWPQYFCGLWDGPKLRVPLGWWSYAWHAVRHIRSGDVVLFDNYELIYVLAAYLTRLQRRVSFIFDYEDGKHLIDKSIFRLLTGAAESLGRPLVRAAVLAHPSLGRRMPPSVPTELVPGFVVRQNPGHKQPPNGTVDLLYSGSWDAPRGVDLLLQALEFLPPSGWHLHISGEGLMADALKGAAENPKWRGKVTVHGSLASDEYAKLLQRCHVGINAQRASDPISGATFPSKIFTYLSNDMLVVSSTASEVPAICGEACRYYSEETPQALAKALTEPITAYERVRNTLDLANASTRYSVEGTAERLKKMLERAKLI